FEPQSMRSAHGALALCGCALSPTPAAASAQRSLASRPQHSTSCCCAALESWPPSFSLPHLTRRPRMTRSKRRHNGWPTHLTNTVSSPASSRNCARCWSSSHRFQPRFARRTGRRSLKSGPGLGDDAASCSGARFFWRSSASLSSSTFVRAPPRTSSDECRRSSFAELAGDRAPDFVVRASAVRLFRLWIRVALPPVASKERPVGTALDDVARLERHLSSSARQVDGKVWYREARGVSRQGL